MIMKNLILLLFLSPYAFAQTPELDALKSEIERNKQGELDEQARIDTLKASRVKLEQELLTAQNMFEKWDDNKDFVQVEIEKTISSLPVTARMVGKRGAFYRCIQDNLRIKGVSSTKDCQKYHKPKLREGELKLIADWDQRVGKSKNDLNTKIKNLELDLVKNENMVKVHDSNIRSMVFQRPQIELRLNVAQRKIEEKKLIQENDKFAKCSPETPTINLEEEAPFEGAKFKGPFHNIPRDNQDGLGTCFANAAKNMLVGISKGEDNASFLDMALQFKRDAAGNLNGDIEGGETCSTLNQIQKYGYCPKDFSPVEMGEKNEIADGLFSPYSTDLNSHSAVIDMLGDFFEDKSKFEKNSKDLSLLSNAKMIIDDLSTNPDVTLPLPVLRYPIPGQGKLQETWIWTLKKGVPEKEFYADHEAAYAAFRPKYVAAVLAGKGLDDIFKEYTSTMADFINKYKLDSALQSFKYSYKAQVESDFGKPNLPGRVRASLNFLRKHIKKDDMTDNDFLNYCMTSNDQEVGMMKSLFDLSEKLNRLKIDPANLFDDKGKFKYTSDLMQLAIAPSCLNEDNRKKPKYGFFCGTVLGNELNGATEKREVVIKSLLQGYPVGNTFHTGSGWHINTIAGLRFNPQTQSCELLIRESQDGVSRWVGEEHIYKKVERFTEVRRK